MAEGIGRAASLKATGPRITEALDELAELKACMTIEDGDTCMVLDEGRRNIEGEAVKMSDHAAMMCMCKTIGELYGAVTALARRVEDGNGF